MSAPKGMIAFMETTFADALELIDRLSVEEQDALVEIVRRRMLEQRRSEIAANAQATVQAYREGRASYGAVDDLRRELGI